MNDQPIVLYVEDDAQSRKLMNMLLKGRLKLPNVFILEDSEDFLARVNALEPKPNVIFLDIHMKPYDGFEMLEMLQQLQWTAGIPVVALTASVMNEEVRRLRIAGFSGCIAKPIDLDTFPDILARVFDGESVWRIID
jgi:CheY-like chemotaxis protein